MNKVVNIYPSMAILSVNPPIRTTQVKVTKSTSEIRACIIARAIVDEVLPNGKTIRLNLNNYNKDNVALCCKPEPKVIPTVVNDIPVKDTKLDVKQEIAKAPVSPVGTVPSTENPEKETVEVGQPQFIKRKKNKKNRHANRDIDRVVDSTNTSEESVVEAKVSADATDTESTETADVETLS